MPTVNLPAYFKTIKKKTGKTPADFKKLAEKKGLLLKGKIKEGVKANDFLPG